MISVIIPTKDRPEQLFRCLDSLCKQKGNIPFEVITIFNGDYNLKKLKEYTKKITFFYKKTKICSAGIARNIGTFMAKGELLAFTDDDCIIKSDWIKNISAYFNKPKNKKIICVGGSVLPYSEEGGLINKYLSYTNHLNGPIRENGRIINMASANLIVKKDYLLMAGGFDKRFKSCGAEDQNLISRIIPLGKIAFSNKISVFHDHNISFRSFRKKYQNYGYGVYTHYFISSQKVSKKTIMYAPYCKKGVDLFIKFPFILFVSLRRLHDNLKKINYLYPAFLLLSIIQEYNFQMGAIKAYKFLNNKSVLE